MPLISQALSSKRLASYQELVQATDLESSVGAYIWGMELNAAFSPLLNMVEVVLRNNLHRVFSEYFGKADWYQDVLKSEGDRAWKNKVLSTPSLIHTYYRKGVPPHHKRTIWKERDKKILINWRSPSEGKFEEIILRLNRSGKDQSPDQVIANAMFGFWVTLFESNFESASDPLALWPSCESKLFSHNLQMSRSRAYELLIRIRDIRNRVSHHEPVWRLATTKSPKSVSLTLSIRILEIRELLDAMSPDVTKLLDAIGYFDRLEWLIDCQTIAAFAGQKISQSIDVRKVKRQIEEIAKQAQRSQLAPLIRPEKVVAIYQGKKRLLTILPNH